jgi:hypothetical protein
MTDPRDGFAVARMLNTCYVAFTDQAGAFTCGEIEAIADAYEALDSNRERADLIIDRHSYDDTEDDDLHYDPDKQGGRA